MASIAPIDQKAISIGRNGDGRKEEQDRHHCDKRHARPCPVIHHGRGVSEVRLLDRTLVPAMKNGKKPERQPQRNEHLEERNAAQHPKSEFEERELSLLRPRENDVVLLSQTLLAFTLRRIL